MIYLTTQNDKVQIIHHKPFDPQYGIGKTAEELLKTGFLTELAVPTYDLPLEKGKSPELYYTPSRGFWYELVTVSEGILHG